MAFVTGQANDLAALRQAILNACTANGWALNTNVLSKGGVFVEVTTSGVSLLFRGGLGIDGTDQLTTPGPSSPCISDFAQPITYPVTYEIHVLTAPDEVYVVVNYNVEFWQWAAWGQSDVAGLPGAGVWYAASKGIIGVPPEGLHIPGANESGCEIPWLFGWVDPASGFGTANSFIHHGFDGGAWNAPNHPPNESRPQPNAWEPAWPLQHVQPNAWNDEAILVPIQVWVRRTIGGKVSLTADMAHARWLRIDFIDPGDIITLGPDSWKVYPIYRKDASDRDAVATPNNLQHSGTYGWAVRYTGP